MQVKVNYENIFRALADRTRIRIMRLLINTGEEICVCEFVDSLELPQYNISKNLKILFNSGLIAQKKEGRWVYYSANKNNSPFLKNLYKSISLLDDYQFKNDMNEFNKRLKIRENGRCLSGITKVNFA